jgi:hypothetical protein
MGSAAGRGRGHLGTNIVMRVVQVTGSSMSWAERKKKKERLQAKLIVIACRLSECGATRGRG